jgi:arylsulfatase A-like enzyme
MMPLAWSWKELGLEDNTIIIFTSDNGGVASGDAFSTTNLPLRGGKGYQWEGGIREPYFIKVPGQVEQKSIAYPVTGADLYPTILDLAGIPLIPDQHRDGVSLKPLLEGNSLPDRPLFWHYPHYGNQGGEPASMIREGEWKFIHYWEDGHNELYNLTSDPMEQNNVLAQHTEQGKILETKLNDFLESVNANMPEEDVEFDPELAKEMHQQRIDVLLPRLEAERLEFLSKEYQPNADWWGSKVTID